MIHHDSRQYDVAVSETAKHFQKKLEDQIHGSVRRVTEVITQVENDVPEDAVAAGRALQFKANDAFFEKNDRTTTAIQLYTPDQKQLNIHDHALQQIGDRADIRNLNTVIREMRDNGQWGARLVAHMLNEIYSHMNGDRFLIRQVRGEVRGFMSDKYRRLDSRPLLDAFMKGIAAFGARPMDGFALQTKVHLRAVLPYIFEPVPGEIMWFGAEIRDSDYGDGKLAVNGWVDRAWCTNLATTEDVLTKTHLGKRLPDDVQFSEKTYRLDTEAWASAVHDVTQNVLGPEAVHRYLGLVKTAAEQKIETGEIHAWVKKNLGKEEGQKAIEKFSGADIEMLPAGQTKWRWSNALSWLANETADERRKLELQDFAGEVLRGKKPEEKAA